jgi:ABC-type nitrate/sulfonate/bicarbonate transport system permease component
MTAIEVEKRPRLRRQAPRDGVTRGAGTRSGRLLRSGGLAYLAVVAVSLAVWQVVSTMTDPLYLPSPSTVARAAADGIADGSLPHNIGISYFRVLSGWAIGTVIAIPIGLVAGRSSFVRTVLAPYIHFFRFIPPIAFVTLALIYFGIGEMSKVSLVIYTTTFVVLLNTMDGALSVSVEKIRAAQSLGASRLKVMTTVVVPASIPDIVTGMRIGMGNAFMTVVAAELVAAQAGIGFMIFNARVLLRTDIVFVGIITLGVMGFVADAVFRQTIQRATYRYGIRS